MGKFLMTVLSERASETQKYAVEIEQDMIDKGKKCKPKTKAKKPPKPLKGTKKTNKTNVSET